MADAKWRECSSCGFPTHCYEVPEASLAMPPWYCAICLHWHRKWSEVHGGDIALMELIAYGLNAILERLD